MALVCYLRDMDKHAQQGWHEVENKLSSITCSAAAGTYEFSSTKLTCQKTTPSPEGLVAGIVLLRPIGDITHQVIIFYLSSSMSLAGEANINQRRHASMASMSNN